MIVRTRTKLVVFARSVMRIVAKLEDGVPDSDVMDATNAQDVAKCSVLSDLPSNLLVHEYTSRQQTEFTVTITGDVNFVGTVPQLLKNNSFTGQFELNSDTISAMLSSCNYPNITIMTDTTMGFCARYSKALYLKSIDDLGLSALKQISFPASNITSITTLPPYLENGYRAFAYNTSLTEIGVELPSTLNIGNKMFFQCTNLSGDAPAQPGLAQCDLMFGGTNVPENTQWTCNAWD